MANDDGREIAANIFDRTAKLAAGLAGAAPGPAGAALLVASGISAVVAGIIRSLGIDGAKEAIDELVARRDEGTITDAHVARDNSEIADAVSDLYEGDEKPKRKTSSSRRKPKKAKE